MTSRPSQRKRVLSGMRSTGKLHLGKLCRRAGQLGAHAGPVRLLFLRGGLARAYHRLRGYFEDQGKLAGSSARLAGCGARSRALHHVHPIACSAACRIAFAVFDDHATGLAGARPYLQGAAREHCGKRPEHLRIPRVPGPAGGGHPHLQRRFRSGGRRPGAARRADSRDRAPLQHVLYPERACTFFPSRSRC